MAEFTELFPLGKQLDGLMHVYQHIITFNLQNFLIVCVIITLFFFIFYQIFHGMFFWFLEIRPNALHDLEEGIPLADGASLHLTLFQALVQTDMETWEMAATLEEGDFDEKRGEKLRASKKLPPLVSYGMHDDTTRSCGDCAICLEDFEVDQFCQVFPECKHIFHSNCVDQWLQWKLTCPICRSCIM